ncbi:hypothetical protein [Microvirga pakistanensis]|uniref:hypothetical protein n=1 Tax=Microvirga pakistanensis TaxID=1682650 RepID=UPI00106D87CF|nr:hypothetical protein [Microvirga pakistanensis]
MSHKYSLGQLVHSAGASFADRTGGVYEVVRLMPESSNGELGYRIRHTTSGTERAVGESEIRAVAAEEAHTTAG